MGIGLRVGLYLTFAASWIAKYVSAEGFREMQKATLAFLLANLVSLCRIAQQRSMTGGEVVIIMYLFLSQFNTAISPARGTWMGGMDPPSFLLLLLSFANKGFWIWFWFVGLDVLPRPPCGNSPYGFVFAPVSLLGGFRIFMRILWVVMALKSARNLVILLKLAGSKFKRNEEMILHNEYYWKQANMGHRDTRASRE